MLKSLNLAVNITLLLKLQNITDISLCKKVLHSLHVIKKFLAGKVSVHSKNIGYKVKRQSQNMHSGCCPPLKRYV